MLVVLSSRFINSELLTGLFYVLNPDASPSPFRFFPPSLLSIYTPSCLNLLACLCLSLNMFSFFIYQNIWTCVYFFFFMGTNVLNCGAGRALMTNIETWEGHIMCCRKRQSCYNVVLEFGYQIWKDKVVNITFVPISCLFTPQRKLVAPHKLQAM